MILDLANSQLRSNFSKSSLIEKRLAPIKTEYPSSAGLTPVRPIARTLYTYNR